MRRALAYVWVALIAAGWACGPGPKALPGADERGSWPGAWPGEACDAQAQCAAGLDCVERRCVWPVCVQDVQCGGAGRVCLMGRCVALELQEGMRCDGVAQCISGLVCAQGRCAPACMDGASCEAGQVCEGGVCVAARPCHEAPDPVAACQEALGVARAACESGHCFNLEQTAGAVCTADTQCGAGLVCEASRCVRTCTGSCAAGLDCTARPSGEPGSVCVLLPAQRGCALEPDPDLYCDAGGPDEQETWRCDRATGECVVAQPKPGCAGVLDWRTYCSQELGVPTDAVACDRQTGECSQVVPPGPRVVVIEDQVLSQESCAERMEIGGQPLRSPGVDLTVVRLEGRGGFKLSVVYHAPGTAPVGNDRGEPAVLEGSNEPVVFDEAFCPLDPQTLAVTGEFFAMGCGGKLAVSFLDFAGEPVELRAGDTLLVGELGPACGVAGAVEDVYKVRVCDTLAAYFSMGQRGCRDLTPGLMDGAGTRRFMLD